MSDLPFVSCLCIAGKDEFNLKYLLPQAVKCFERQTYPADKRELVIVADPPYTKDSDGMAVADDTLHEYRDRARCWIVPYPQGHERPTLGKLRNISIDQAKGPLCLQWDSDDWHHPERIAAQVAVYQNNPGVPVVLRRQLCYSFTDDTACVREYDAIPIVGTVLFPKTDFRYPEKAKGEDADFLSLWPRRCVFDNDPALYLRLEHGHNTWQKNNILMSFDGPWAKGGWHISDRLRDVLQGAIRQYPGEVWPSGYRPVFGTKSAACCWPYPTKQTTVPMLEAEDA